MNRTGNRSLINFASTRTMIQVDLKESLARHLGIGPDGKFKTNPEALMRDSGIEREFRSMAHRIDVMDPQAFVEEVTWGHPSVAEILLAQTS